MLYIIEAKDEKTARKGGRLIGTMAVDAVAYTKADPAKDGTGGKLYARVIPTFTLQVEGEAVTFGNRPVAVNRSLNSTPDEPDTRKLASFTV